MGFSYERLWELSIKRRINKTSLRDILGTQIRHYENYL